VAASTLAVTADFDLTSDAHQTTIVS